MRDQECIEYTDPVLLDRRIGVKDEIKNYELKEVVLDPAGLLTAGGVIIRESLRLQSHLPKRLILRGGEALVGANLLAAPLSSNYYHFMLEDVPRILLARKELGNIRVVVVQVPSSFQAQVLEMLDVDVVVRTRSTAFPVVNFLNISQPSGLEHASVVELSDALMDASDGLSGPIRTKSNSQPVYISRRGSSRSLHGEEALEEALRKKGFRVVRTEQLSVVEQIRMFQSTECVVAPHGAGLSNIAFCASGTRVVEIMDIAYANPCFQAIARAKSLKYYQVATWFARPIVDVAKEVDSVLAR